MKSNEPLLVQSMNQTIEEYKAPKHPPNFIYSMMFLVRDGVLCCIVWYLYHLLQDLQYIPEILLYPLYSLLMGTVAMGLWVLGHECGHGAFGRTKLQNDSIGFIVHSMLLVPYFSWQYSHNKHHKYTNHLIRGETHVPNTKKGAAIILRIKRVLGDDTFAIISVFLHMVLGWPLYLWLNATGGRTVSEQRIDRRGKLDHFRPSSQIMPDRIKYKVMMSTIGCTITLVSIWWYELWYDYTGPYMIVNSWLIVYTWLQHTHPDVPHYGHGSKYTHTIGALCTIDRPYPWLIDHLHHHIGTTHVTHHLNYGVPHYRAVECTRRLKPILGDRYIYDSTSIWRALFNVAKTCIYVESVDGVQYYKS